MPDFKWAATALPFLPMTFDIAVMVLVIAFVPEPEGRCGNGEGGPPWRLGRNLHVGHAQRRISA